MLLLTFIQTAQMVLGVSDVDIPLLAEAVEAGADECGVEMSVCPAECAVCWGWEDDFGEIPC